MFSTICDQTLRFPSLSFQIAGLLYINVFHPYLLGKLACFDYVNFGLIRSVYVTAAFLQSCGIFDEQGVRHQDSSAGICIFIFCKQSCKGLQGYYSGIQFLKGHKLLYIYYIYIYVDRPLIEEIGFQNSA